jgi:formate hydrogenlyase subunit 6/NADH:ubiquinone oxidoreductase subunit I
VSAIFMGKDYELAVYSKDDFIWDKTDLLVQTKRRRNAAVAALVRLGLLSVKPSLRPKTKD